MSQLKTKKRRDMRERFRAYHIRYTRSPHQMSAMAAEQRQLKDLDEGLSLRFHVLDKRWGIYYDHRGLLTCIRTIQAHEPWALVFRDVRRNAGTSKRQLVLNHAAGIQAQKRRVDERVREVGREIGTGLYHMTTNRVMAPVP